MPPAEEAWLHEWINVVAVLDIDEKTLRHHVTLALELKKAGTPIPSNDP